MRVFENYVKKYDMNNINIKSKYFHSLKVMELSRDIASTVGGFNDDEIVVCELIGLFHGISAFDNVNSLKMEDDNEDALKSIDILFKKGLIRDITSDKKYNEIIRMAILAYNKDDLLSDMDNMTKKFCLVIRDAHRIDMFRMALNYPHFDMHIESYPSEMVYDSFKLFRPVNKAITENNSDEVLVILSSVFEFSFRYSYVILKENKYMDNLIEGLLIKDKDIEKFFKQLLSVLNSYVNKRIGENNFVRE